MSVAQKTMIGVVTKEHYWLERERLLGTCMLAPAVLYIAVLVGFPFFFALYLSMTNATVGNPYGSFIGLSNFIDILQSPIFRRALRNTFVFTICSQLIVLVLAKVLALALAGEFRGKGVIQFLILLPWVAPISIGAIGWLWIFDSQYSIIDWFCGRLAFLGQGNGCTGLENPI
jgi:multiple sugar transport system permease protein